MNYFCMSGQAVIETLDAVRKLKRWEGYMEDQKYELLEGGMRVGVICTQN